MTAVRAVSRAKAMPIRSTPFLRGTSHAMKFVSRFAAPPLHRSGCFHSSPFGGGFMVASRRKQSDGGGGPLATALSTLREQVQTGADRLIRAARAVGEEAKTKAAEAKEAVQEEATRLIGEQKERVAG